MIRQAQLCGKMHCNSNIRMRTNTINYFSLSERVYGNLNNTVNYFFVRMSIWQSELH